MIIPLLDPAELAPLVTQSEKRKVLNQHQVNAGDRIEDETPDKLLEDANLNGSTWLFTYDKHPCVYQEWLWMLFVSTVVDFSPGNGSLALQCIRFRIPVILIARNALHQKIIQDNLVRQLSACVCDPMDERFYDAAELGIQRTKR